MKTNAMTDLARRFRTAADSLDRIHKELFSQPSGGSVKGSKARPAHQPRESKRKLHWMQRPENAAKVKRMVRKMHAGKRSK